MKMLQETQSTGEAQTPTPATNEAQSNQQNALGSEAPAADSGSASASAATNDSRKVSREDIELVQNLIERCLQLYMNRGEVVRTLSTRAKIEPGFTTLGGRSLAFYVHTLRIDNLSLKIAVIFCLICIVKCSFSMAETGRRKRRVFPGLLYKAEIEKTNHHVQSFIGTPIPPYEVPSSPEGSVGAYTKWDSSYACAVNNLPMGYPVIQQPLMQVPGQPHLDSMGCGLSSCHVVNGIPAPGGFHPIRMNSGNDVAPEAAPAAPPCGAMSSMSEMAVSPTSVASSNHFPFTPTEISGMGMDASMLDAAFTTDVGNASALQLGPDGGVGSSRDSGRSLGQLWNFSLSDLAVDMSNLGDFGALEDYTGSPFLPSDSDILLDSPDQDDIVEEYFADTIAGPCSQSDEEKS